MATSRGVVVEFDFTALNGAEVLFKATKRLLSGLDIPFDSVAEAKYLAGENYQDGLARYFSVIKTKKTAAKAAKDLSAAFVGELNAAVPKAVTAAFRNFVKALTDKGLKVVIATRSDLTLAPVQAAFAGLTGETVVLYQETSATYGGVKWDAWRRACAANQVRHHSSLAVTGSGYGVKSALLAGMASVAVQNDLVAYQDFGGADAVVRELSGTTVKVVLDAMRIN